MIISGKEKEIITNAYCPKILAIGKELHFKRKPFYDFLKRFFDLFLSIIALLLAGWLMILIGFAVKIQDGGSVFYVSTRVTKNGKLFNMYKFRTMVVGAEQQLPNLSSKNETNGPTFKMKDDPRITKLGRFLRKTSLDELPQLLNTLNGSMSFVGPRPPLPNEVNRYCPEDYAKLLVKQGITCIWQVSGRSLTTFEQQIEMDKEYVSRRNIFFDFWLLLRTIPAVLFQKGAE